MGQVEISEVEKKVLPKCDFIWEQTILSQSEKILTVCQTKGDLIRFFKECEDNIKKLENNCRIIWNNHVQSFGGDEYGYLIYFYSDILGVPIKLSLRIDTFEQVIVIGNMDIATKKEERKLQKALKENSTTQTSATACDTASSTTSGSSTTATTDGDVVDQ